MNDFATKDATKRFPRSVPVELLSAICWIIGGVILLLLNGKPYSNLLFFIGAVTLSALFWGWEMVGGNRQRLGWIILAFHLLVIAASVGNLSAAKAAQDGFEKAMQRARQVRN